MKCVKTNSFELSDVKRLSVRVEKFDYLPEEPNEENEYGPHSHNCYEIYFHLGEGGSFIAQDNIYPLKSGAVAVLPPNTFHNIILENSERHSCFCLFAEGDYLDELLFVGRTEIIYPDEKNTSEIENIFKSLCEVADSASEYLLFFSLLRLIRDCADGAPAERASNIPKDLLRSVNYICENMSTNIKITDIAKYSGVSVNTLERRFLKFFGVSPADFVAEKRLSASCELLLRGEMTVEQVSRAVCFSSPSAFISKFKRKFGMTPLRYKKKNGGANYCGDILLKWGEKK